MAVNTSRAWYQANKERLKAERKEWYRLNKDEQKNSYIMKKYGISLAHYKALWELQYGCCKICGNPETRKHQATGKACSLSVDHCHETGKVRGLLCSRCNICIGRFDDDSELLRAAATYIDGSNKSIVQGTI